MAVLRVKPGVRFDRIDPGGFRLLGSLDRVVRSMASELVITCGSDSHPSLDPHTLGRAYDVRTHSLTPEQKDFVLRGVLLDLEDGVPMETSGGLATANFFGWLEHKGEDGEHLHFQQRRGVSFPQ